MPRISHSLCTLSLRDPRSLARLLLALIGAWLLGFEINVLWGPGQGHSIVFGRVAYESALALGGLLCVARGALYVRERMVWLAIGVGCLMWVAGDVYYEFVLVSTKVLPVPSLADAGYLVFYPFVFAGVIMLLRARSGRASAAQWLDGLSAALAAAALSAAVGLDLVLKSLGGRPIEVATFIAYPVGDILILGAIVGALALCRLRSGRVFLWLAFGISSFCVADTLYLVASAAGTYHVGIWFDVGWPAGMALVAVAAWSRAPETASLSLDKARGLGSIALPVIFAVLSIGLLLYTGSKHLNLAARGLAAASLGVILMRFLQTFRDNAEVTAQRSHESRTDALTGLPNRRALTSDFADVVANLTSATPAIIAIFDLDGFKHYNDTFGHHAGDALLARLGAKLRGSVEGAGRAYRMGGDEFCVIIQGDTSFDAAVRRAAGALIEVGEGFAVRSSYGQVHMPQEAADAELALRLADQRMYDHKSGGRSSAMPQSRDVLLQALRERTPDLGEHVRGVRELAEAIARTLRASESEIAAVGSTADLHDIGKMAIPRTILNKPGPLSDVEWGFIHRHTIIGARIVSAAPSLAEVALAVRGTHERWDGCGYPDRLAGADIPFPARVVAVCDAFDAMTAGRPYAAARSTDDAVIELQRCSGTQFDPAAVDALQQVLVERTAERTLDPAARAAGAVPGSSLLDPAGAMASAGVAG